MRGKRILVLLLVCLLMLFSTEAEAAGGRKDRQLTDLTGMSGWPSAPTISGESAYLIEVNSGTVLYAKSANTTRYPASITKVMTALVVLENCELDEEVTFSHNAIYDIEDGGHNWSYQEGEVLTVEQCLYALLLESVNEAGYALAEHVAGSIEDFAQLMNEKAEELGCTNTNFVNPHGLNDSEHVTTAHDMALIFWAALQNEDFYTIDSTTKYTIPATELNPSGYSLTMHHKMMLSSSDYYYEGVLAGKTGYTSLAQNTLVTYAERDGMALVCVVMKAGGSGTIYQDTEALLDYGFDNFQLVDMTSTSQSFCYALSTGYPLSLTLDGVSKMVLPKNVSTLTLEFSSKTSEDVDGTVGRLLFYSGDTVVATSTVRASGSIGASVETLVSTEISESETPAAELTNAESESEIEENVSEEEITEEEIPLTEEETEAQSEASEKKEKKIGWKILFWILNALGALIGLVFLYWLIIQIIKARRRRRRRKRRQLQRQRAARARARARAEGK